MVSLPQLTPFFCVVFNSISVREPLTLPHILTPFRVHGVHASAGPRTLLNFYQWRILR